MTSQPSVSAKTGATTRAPKPRPTIPIRSDALMERSFSHRCRRVGVAAADTEVQPHEEPVTDRSDAEREQDRADADVAAECESDGQRDELDDRAHEPQRVTARGKRGHQAVARPGPEAGADVQRHAERGDDDPTEEHRPPHREVVHLWEHVEHAVHDEPDREGVDDRADAGALLQRDPREEHHEADEHDDEAEREPGDLREALMEDVPRSDAELGVEERRDADTEHDDPGEEARQPASELALARPREDLQRDGLAPHRAHANCGSQGAVASSSASAIDSMASVRSRLVSGSRRMASTTSARSPVSAASTAHSCARDTRCTIVAGSEGRVTVSRPRAPSPSTTHMLSTTTSLGRSATWSVLGRFSGNQPGVFVSMHWTTAATSSPDGIASTASAPSMASKSSM